MTSEEIEAKWAATEQMLKIDPDSDFKGEEGDRLATSKCLVKSYLRGAISELRLLDKHDEKYQTPWTRNQFLWALREPVGDSKCKQAKQWWHECFAMTKKYGRMTA